MARIKTFDDWVEVMREWQKGIDVDPEIFQRVLGGYQLEAKYGDLKYDEIEFGEFAGKRKWEKVLEIPDQRMRDAAAAIIREVGVETGGSNIQFAIDPATGRVLMTELVAEDRVVRATIVVRFRSEPLDGILLPRTMRERYEGRTNKSVIEGSATYDKFRQFQVNVDEKFQLKK